MFNQLRGWEWLIIVALILLLFGAKRLPDTARGLGRSLRIFKAETKGMVEDGKVESVDSAQVPAIGPTAPEASVATSIFTSDAVPEDVAPNRGNGG
jgi:sec-independent protein translocase protein TatA